MHIFLLHLLSIGQQSVALAVCRIGLFNIETAFICNHNCQERFPPKKITHRHKTQ